jgi:hypothetical protein
VSSDLVVANLECAITGHESPWSRTPKRFQTCELMQVLSAELGTRFERNRDGLVVRLPGRNR